MVTYQVNCGACQKAMLFEHAQRLRDPGTLPAFCSDDCSRAFFRHLMADAVDGGAVLVDLPCGCVCAVFGPQHTHPWMVCDQALQDFAGHSIAVHRQALEMVGGT